MAAGGASRTSAFAIIVVTVGGAASRGWLQCMLAAAGGWRLLAGSGAAV
jgi:hypothetical protein